MAGPPAANVRPLAWQMQLDCEVREHPSALMLEDSGSRLAMQSTQTVSALPGFVVLGIALVCAIVLPSPVTADTGGEVWLRYSALSSHASKLNQRLPEKTDLLPGSLVLKPAQL